MAGERSRIEGIILVLISGLLLLIALVGIAFLHASRFAASTAQAVFSSTATALAAASGAEYAAARLAQDPYPGRLKTPESRADDWTCRDPLDVPVERLANPSYSHGESWTNVPASWEADGVDNDRDARIDEAGEGMGLFAGDIPGPDLDGDGGFSAWSGRLRSGGTRGITFSLRIDAVDGRIPVNAGSLFGDDHYGGNVVWRHLSNNVPDHRDLDLFYHQALAHVLDNLGILCNIATRRENLATGDPLGSAETVQISWLGRDILANRPQGGYRDWDHLRGVLTGLSVAGGPYTDADLRMIRPFLNFGPYDALGETGRNRGREGEDFPPYVPIQLTVAPREVMQAVWMYLTHDPSDSIYCPGEPAGWDGPSSQTSLPFKDSRIVIFPHEAERLAALTASLRAEGALSWKGLYQAFATNARDLFAEDRQDLEEFPVARRNWIQAKADLAFRAATLDPYLCDGIVEGNSSWIGYCVDRDPGPDGAPGAQLWSAVGFHEILRICLPVAFGAGWPEDPLDPYDHTYNGGGAGARILPQGFSLSHPLQFEVTSCAQCRGPSWKSARTVSGRLRSHERIDFTGQEDFENLRGGTILARRGIRVVDDPAPQVRRDLCQADRLSDGTEPLVYDFWNPGGKRRAYPRIVSLPRFNRRAFTSDTAGPMFYGYLDSNGALGLAGLEAGHLGADLYFPAKEDFDRILNSPCSDFWSEPGGFPDDLSCLWPLENTEMGLQTADVTPYSVFGIKWAFDCPGFWNPPPAGPGNIVEAVSLEAWMGPRSEIWISKNETLTNNDWVIRLYTDRSSGLAAEEYGTTFTVRVTWGAPMVISGEDGGAIPNPNCWDTAQFFMPDAAPEGTLPWNYHVVLTIAPEQNKTIFRLHVNGSSETDDLPMELVHEGLTQNTYPERLVASFFDELRICDAVLPPEEILRRYRHERFVRSGLYTSPLYVPDAPMTMDRAQCVRLAPPSLYEADLSADPNPVTAPLKLEDGKPVPIDPFAVRIHGYADEAGTLPIPGSPVTLGGSDETQHLGMLGLPGPIRSFRYEVGFDCTKVAGVLRDTPMFDSLWMTFRRTGAGGRWSAWSVR